MFDANNPGPFDFSSQNEKEEEIDFFAIVAISTDSHVYQHDCSPCFFHNRESYTPYVKPPKLVIARPATAETESPIVGGAKRTKEENPHIEIQPIRKK